MNGIRIFIVRRVELVFAVRGIGSGAHNKGMRFPSLCQLQLVGLTITTAVVTVYNAFRTPMCVTERLTVTTETTKTTAPVSVLSVRVQRYHSLNNVMEVSNHM